MNEEGKSIKQIKQEDYIKLVELVGRKRADEIFEGDENFDDDTKYPIKEIQLTIFFASIRKFIFEKPAIAFLILLIVILISILAYYKVSYYW